MDKNEIDGDRCSFLSGAIAEGIWFGDEMLHTKAMLDEIKEGIINAYESKTKMTRGQISQLMDAQSCFNAKKAVELGFTHNVLYAENQSINNSELIIFYRTAVTNSIISRLQQRPHSVPVADLERQLANIKKPIQDTV